MPAPPMRLLFYVESLGLGGANETTVATAIAMKRRGHHVVFASRGGWLKKKLEQAQILHVELDTAVRHPSLTLARRLRDLLEREKIDVACPNGWDCFVDMLVAALPSGVPVVPTFPSVYPEYHHPRVPGAIVFSGEYRDTLIRRYGWKPGALEMLIHRIDTERLHPGVDGAEMRARWGLEAQTPVVLLACRLDPMKIGGVRFLLDSVPALHRRCPAARVVLAGDGSLAGEVRDRADHINRELGSQVVILAGRVLEMEKAFGAADVVVGNGARSGMEGMACGRCIVSIGEAGFAGVFTRENIEDFAYYNFDKGTVFDGSSRKDPEALAEALADLLARPERRSELGHFCREFAEERLSVDAGAGRLEQLLAAQRRTSPAARIGRGWELIRGVASFLWFAGRRKARRMVTGSSGPSRAAFGTGSEKGAGFLRDSMTSFATRILCLGVGFFQAALTARLLLPEGKGELAAALVIPQLFAMLAPLGINFACTYHLGRKTFDREAMIRNVLTALLFLGAVGILGTLIAAHFLKSSILQGVSNTSFILATLTIPAQIGMLFLLALYRGEMRIWETNLFDLVRAVAIFALIVLFLVPLKLGVTGVILAQFIAEAVVTFWAIRRFSGNAVPVIHWNVLKSLLGYGLQVYSFSILLYLNYRLDLFFVRHWVDLTQTGLYAAAVSLAEVMWIVPYSLGNVLFPSTATTSGPSRDLLTLAVCRRTFYLMLVLCAGLAVTRHLVIRLLFGSQFLGAAPALLLLLPGVLAMSVQNVVGSDLTGRGRPLPVTVGAALGLATNVLLNILWIPRYGIVGASLASSVSYTLVTVIVLAAFVRVTRSRLRDALVLRREDLRALSRLVVRSGEAAA